MSGDWKPRTDSSGVKSEGQRDGMGKDKEERMLKLV